MTQPESARVEASETELPEWWRRPRWLSDPKPDRKRPRSDVGFDPVSVPLVMDAGWRARSLDVEPARALVYDFGPSVLIGAIASLPLPDDVRARWGEVPFWFIGEEQSERSTIFETLPESPESVAAFEEVLASVSALVDPIFAIIESHIGTTSCVHCASHADIDVSTAVKAFEADGFRVVHVTSWPLTRQPARPHGDARFAAALVSPAARFANGCVYEVRNADGVEREEGLGTLHALFDAMSDEAILRVLPSLPRRRDGVAAASYLAARFAGGPHEDEVLTAAARLAGADALEAFAAAGIASTALALPYAELLDAKRAPSFAKRWLRTNLRHAVAGLLPAALRGSRDALNGLQFLATTHADEVLRLSALHGSAARARIEEVLLGDAFAAVPEKLPVLPAFAHPSHHPPLRLANGHVLPDVAVEHLLTMLAFSRPEAPYAGVLAARALLEPRSADAFAWSVFAAWEAGHHRADEWVFLALGHLGGDACARSLAAKVKVWPGEKASARAVRGIDALASIGSDRSLTYLVGIAQRVKFRALREQAQQKVQELAELRGWSADELADRLVPDLDLDADGSRTLDFGPRAFRVSFDAGLTPRLVNAEGKVLAALPKRAASDDVAKVEDATALWKGLKADGKAIAQQVVTRLERMMCTERRVGEGVFRTFFVEHPLVGHLTRRLIWGAYVDGVLRRCFRVAEDRTHADEHDAGFTLPEDAAIGLVHRIELSTDAAARWHERIGDYELIQPFEQLARATYVLTDEETRGTAITRPKLAAKLGRVLALEQRGWQKGPTEGGGWVRRMEKRLPGELVAELALGTGANDGGICMGWMEGTPKEQVITGVSLRRAHDRTPATFDRLTAIATSELLHDVHGLGD